MNIVDWFDIENIEHLKAFYGIEYEGKYWPEGMLPKNIEFPQDYNWASLLSFKIVKHYIQQKLVEKSGEWEQANISRKSNIVIYKKCANNFKSFGGSLL